jgi:hypothetical protein
MRNLIKLLPQTFRSSLGWIKEYMYVVITEILPLLMELWFQEGELCKHFLQIVE